MTMLGSQAIIANMSPGDLTIGYNIGSKVSIGNYRSDSIYELSLVHSYITGMSLYCRTVSITTTLQTYDSYVIADNLSAITIYLPSSPTLGRTVYIRKGNSGDLTVSGNGFLIDMGTEVVSSMGLAVRGYLSMFVYDGEKWNWNLMS